MSSALECKCGSLDSIIGNMLTTSVCNSISLLDTEIMFVTCEDAYPATSKPYHEAVSSEEEVKCINSNMCLLNYTSLGEIYIFNTSRSHQKKDI